MVRETSAPLALNNFVNFVHSVEDSPYWHLSGQQGAGTTWARLACGEPRPPEERAGEAGGKIQAALNTAQSNSASFRTGE